MSCPLHPGTEHRCALIVETDKSSHISSGELSKFHTMVHSAAAFQTGMSPRVERKRCVQETGGQGQGVEQPGERSYEARRAAGLPGHRAGVLQTRLGADLGRHSYTGKASLASMPQHSSCLPLQSDMATVRQYVCQYRCPAPPHTAAMPCVSCLLIVPHLRCS